MTKTGRRTLLWCVLAVGILLGLTPTVGGMWVSYKLVFKPLMASHGAGKPPDQGELQQQIQRDPVFNVTRFILAPIGVVLIVTSLILLRRLRQEPPPPLPVDYGLGRGRE